MANICADTFTNTNGTSLESHDANWIKITNRTAPGEINSNTARAPTAGAPFYYYYNASPSSADYTVDVELAAVTGSRISSALGRVSSSAETFYEAVAISGNLKLFKCVAGSITQLGSTVFEASVATDVIQLDMSSTTIKLNKNTVNKINQTDSAISATGFAGAASDKFATIDNFTANEVSGATGKSNPLSGPFGGPFAGVIG